VDDAVDIGCGVGTLAKDERLCKSPHFCVGVVRSGVANKEEEHRENSRRQMMNINK
jgi:hypothetical protein